MSNPTTIEITTPRCMLCGDNSVMTVDAARYQAWKDGMLIQDAFPEMDTATREVVKTGTHGECWSKMFGNSDDE
jgi:hypothetical protein